MHKSIIFCTGIFPPDIGGPASYVLKMALKMKDEGYRVTIITYSDQIIAANFGLNVIRIRRILPGVSHLKYFFKLINISKEFDIIYLQGSFSEGIPTVLANLFLRKPITIRIGGIFAWEFCINNKLTKKLPDEFYSKIQNPICQFFKVVDRLIINLCDKIIVNSNYTKKLLQLNKISNKNISVIYNSFDAITFEKKNRQALLELFHLPNKKIIVSHGRFVSWKNFDKLVEFSSKLPDDYITVIAGDGPIKNNIFVIINKLELSKKVVILDKQTKENIYHLNSLAHAFILLSSYEGMSNAIVEAMQQGKFVIASNIEANIEALQDYPYSKIIEIKNEQFLSAVKNITIPANKSAINLNRFDFDKIYNDTKNLLCL